MERIEATKRITRSIAGDLSALGCNCQQIAETVRAETGMENYNSHDASLDLWNVRSWSVFPRTASNGKIARYLYHPEEHEEIIHTCASMMAGAILKAMDDLYRGKPCSLEAKAPWNRTNDRCTIGNQEPHTECHNCAPDAWAWLTSYQFKELCGFLAWDWERQMEYAWNQMLETSAAFPWIPLIPALVWRIAVTIEGEAGPMGPTGLWYVADTMLSRARRGDTWEEILTQYYARDTTPSGEAMALANKMLTRPWKPSGRVFCYSESDRLNQNWKRGELVYTVNGYTLHMSQAWPGS